MEGELFQYAFMVMVRMEFLSRSGLMVKEYAEYEVQRALHQVCSANTPKDALECFQRNRAAR
jgi:hypothetical protein